MALIKCPECGKEISDKASSCPNCGCPIEIQKTEVVNNISEQQITRQSSKKLNKKIIPIVVILAVVAIICVIIYNVKVVKPRKLEAQNKATYEEAIDLLEKGKYEEANDIFGTIPEYEDVETLQEQLFYESRVFQCVKSIKERLKNPDSLQIYEVVFFSKEYKDDVNVSDSMKEALNKLIADEGGGPVVLMRYGAQNGFGGNTTSYAMFVYLNDKYEFLGSCDTLDTDKVDDDDKQMCEIINMIKDYFKTTGDVDIDRIKQVLKDDNYTSIRIIE